MMSQNFEKLQTSLKKQARELNFYDIEDFDIKVEKRLPEKFKMPNLPKFDEIGDPMTHLRSYLIAIKTT